MKKVFILLFALCSALFIYAQPNEYIIDRGMDETAHAIDISSMGYMVAGSTNSIGSGGTDIFLYGLTSNFDTIWSNTMGGPGDDMAWDVCMMNTLMAKMMVSLVGGSWDNGSDKDMYVVELDEYGFSYTDVLFDFGNGDDEILALSASDPYLPCFTGYKTTSLGDKDIVLGWLEDNYYSLDTSSSFSTFSYGGTGDEAGYGVHESGLATIVTGYTTSYGAGGMDALIVNYDRNQTMLSWDKYYGGAGDDVAKKAFFDDTYGQYLVVGYTESFGAGNRDIWLLSLDIAGDTNWTKTYGDIYDDEPYYMEWDNDVLYVAGYTTDPVNMDKNFYFLMIDPLNGDVIDEKISGSPAVDEIAFDLFRDGCYYNLVGDASGDYYMGQKDRISLNPVIKDVDCHGLGEIEIFPSGEGYIMMIEWSTLGAGIFAYDTTFVDNLATGEYNLYLYDDIYGCTIQDTFIIAEIPLMALDSVITDASCGGQCDGTAEVIVTGGQAPFTYLWDPSAGSQTNSLAVDLCMGFYNVTVTDNVNCQQNLFAFVGELPLGYISGTVNNTSYGSIPDDSATVYLLKF
ncbi:MAG: SprB repeat-containing protein, partial [Bacteroidota bacterium]